MKTDLQKTFTEIELIEQLDKELIEIIGINDFCDNKAIVEVITKNCNCDNCLKLKNIIKQIEEIKAK